MNEFTVQDTPAFARLSLVAQGYIAAAFWTWNPEWDDEFQDGKRLTVEMIDAASLAVMEADCARFEAEFGKYFKGKRADAGADFWLTRNRCGCGFWDSPGIWGKEGAEILSAAAHKYPEIALYRGDDGKIYICSA